MKLDDQNINLTHETSPPESNSFINATTNGQKAILCKFNDFDIL